jgi:hypothetical protein
MKVLLMHPKEDFKVDLELPPESKELVEDLGLGTLFAAMAGDDRLVLAVSTAAVLSPLAQPEEIVWRQQALADCIANPGFVKELYTLATDALESHKKSTFWGINRSPESLRYSSVQVLEMFLVHLVRLRRLADEHDAEMASPAFARLRSMLLSELAGPYVELVETHLSELKLTRGLVMSAQLGQANKGTGYILHRGPGHGLRARLASRGQASYSFTVPDRDESGLRALAELGARGVNIAANALAQSVDHIVGFFVSLRTELAFYIGCLNLRAALQAKGEPLCTPLLLPADRTGTRADGLYDPCLSLRVSGRTVGNDLSGEGKTLVVVTGANRGGKSTFLRSVGLAQLMAQCGLFVAARSFSTSVCPRVFTHFKRDEGAAMEGGKLDEELARMSVIVSHISPGCLLLCNEPFGSTNEREGSDIGRHVFLPLADAGVKLFVVTHLFDLAESLYDRGGTNALFLRAPRQEGAQPFRLLEGPPEATAYGEDVYERIFGVPPTEVVLGLSSHSAGPPPEPRPATSTEGPMGAGTAPGVSTNSASS